MGLAMGHCSEFGNIQPTGYLLSSSGSHRHGLMSMARLFPLPNTGFGNWSSSHFTPICALGSEWEFGNCSRTRFAALSTGPKSRIRVNPWHTRFSQGLQGGGKAARTGVTTEPTLFKNSNALAPPFPWNNQLLASLQLFPVLE